MVLYQHSPYAEGSAWNGKCEGCGNRRLVRYYEGKLLCHPCEVEHDEAQWFEGMEELRGRPVPAGGSGTEPEPHDALWPHSHGAEYPAHSHPYDAPRYRAMAPRPPHLFDKGPEVTFEQDLDDVFVWLNGVEVGHLYQTNGGDGPWEASGDLLNRYSALADCQWEPLEIDAAKEVVETVVRNAYVRQPLVYSVELERAISALEATAKTLGWRGAPAGDLAQLDQAIVAVREAPP